MPTDIIKAHMNKYGVVHAMLKEKWSNMYRYAVGNGIRIATIDLKKHIPSHLYIEGYRTHIIHRTTDNMLNLQCNNPYGTGMP